MRYILKLLANLSMKGFIVKCEKCVLIFYHKNGNKYRYTVTLKGDENEKKS